MGVPNLKLSVSALRNYDSLRTKGLITDRVRLVDPSVPGLVGIVGKRSTVFYLRYRPSGCPNPRDLRIGEWGPGQTLDEVRREAHVLRGEVARGRDPQAVRQSGKNEPTVKDLLLTYFSRCDERVRDGKLAETTVHEYRHRVTTYAVPVIGMLRVSMVTTANIEEVLENMRRKGVRKSWQNTRAPLSGAFKVAESLGYRPKGSNPVRGSTPATTGSRQRILTTPEAGRLGDAWAQLARTGNAPGRLLATYALQTAAYTGRRIGAVRHLQWGGVEVVGEVEKGTCPTVRVTFCKDKRVKEPQIVTLPPEAARIVLALRERFGQGEADDFIFWGVQSGREHPQPYATIRGLWLEVLETAALPKELRIHDLRHTFITEAANHTNLSTAQIQGITGHRTLAALNRYVGRQDEVVAEHGALVAKSLGAKYGAQPRLEVGAE